MIDNVEFDTKEGKVGDDKQEERKRGRKRETDKQRNRPAHIDLRGEAKQTSKINLLYFTMICRKA